jgi:uncharacterized protein with NRDE domain
MCLVAWSIDQHARFPLVLASNRDEFRARPTAALDWWPTEADGPRILAGRDLQAGGTWLGLSSHGRLSLLTNIRAPGRQRDDAPSRGDIVPTWLLSPLSHEALWTRTAQAGHNGFNLVSFDFRQGHGHWMNSDHPGLQRLSAGLQGLSNGVLDEPWPKVQALRAAVDAAVRAVVSIDADRDALLEALLQALARRDRAEDAQLPSTGVPLDVERGLSSICIDMPERGYGTRSSTVLVVERLGTGPSSRLEATLVERGLDADGRPGTMRRVDLPDWPGPIGRTSLLRPD